MVGESVDMVARRWASCGEAAIRRRGGGKKELDVEACRPPGVVGEWDAGELSWAAKACQLARCN